VSGGLTQEVLAGIIVLAAAAFLVWRRVRRRARPAAMCGDCPGCAPAASRGPARSGEAGAAGGPFDV
jgi:hypothetical protein